MIGQAVRESGIVSAKARTTRILSCGVRLAVLLFAALAPSWGQTALVHVTSCPAAPLLSSTCPIVTGGSGNLLVVGVQMSGTAASVVANITDDVQNQYSLAAGSRSVDAAGGSSVEIWYAKNSVAGATAVTISLTTTAIVGAVVWEFSGVDLIRPFDQASAVSGESPALSITSPTLTVNSTNEVLIAVSAAQNSVAGPVAGGFSNDASSLGGGWAHLIASEAGAYSAVWAQSSPGTYASSSASFKAVSPTTSCDVNGDGKVDAADVQLVANMEIGAPGFPCTVNIGGVLACSDAARQVVIKAALVQGCHFITLNWSPSPSTRVVGYNVYRGTASGGESATALNTGGPVTGTTFTDVSAISGTTYFYVVKGTDGTNLSPPSQETSATAF